jgi:hypothetical protein
MGHDAMTETVARRPAEARWPAVLTIIAVLALLVLLPERLRLFPEWVIYVTGAVALAPMLAVSAAPGRMVWMLVERWVTIGLVAIGAASNLVMLMELMFDMVRRSHAVSGLQLLTSSIAVWAVNVLMFSLLYWQVDRGGPPARAASLAYRPDWLFPADQAPPEAVAAGWRPQFVDYLFLGFSTATAFSTTDALPLTGRAKFAMMVESLISLVTLVVVGARAINVLGG